MPPDSIMLYASLAAGRDDLVSELLASALRVEGLDARSATLPLPQQGA